ncbi:MAG: hypothetical protein RLZZ93_1427 [Actinomycetota bacterium]
MDDALLGGCVEGPAHVDAHDQGLAGGEPAAPVEELPQGPPGQPLGHCVHVPLAVESGVTMVVHRLDAGMTEALGHGALGLEHRERVGRRGGAEERVDQAGQGGDAHGHQLGRGEVGGVELHRAGVREGGFRAEITDQVPPAEDGAGHVCCVPHDPKEPTR